MIIKEWDAALIVTDNVLTNLPISKLSSIPMDVDGLFPSDLILISRLCDLSNMTETGYMSYNATMAEVSAFTYDALGIDEITSNISQISVNLDSLLIYKGMLERMTVDQLAKTDIYDGSYFDPLMISAIHAVSGVLLEELSGYRLSYAMENIFNWKTFQNGKFTRLTATYLTAINANITNLTASKLTATDGDIANLSANKLTATDGDIANLTVNNINGQTYKNITYAIAESEYQRQSKAANTFYFTYY